MSGLQLAQHHPLEGANCLPDPGLREPFAHRHQLLSDEATERLSGIPLTQRNRRIAGRELPGLVAYAKVEARKTALRQMLQQLVMQDPPRRVFGPLASL